MYRATKNTNRSFVLDKVRRQWSNNIYKVVKEKSISLEFYILSKYILKQGQNKNFLDIQKPKKLITSRATLQET